jgi:hypothetical protein
LSVDLLAAVGRQDPAPGRLVEACALNPRLELDVAAQVEFVGDPIEPPLDLRLAGELLAPAPAFVEILRK